MSSENEKGKSNTSGVESTGLFSVLREIIAIKEPDLIIKSYLDFLNRVEKPEIAFYYNIFREEKAEFIFYPRMNGEMNIQSPLFYKTTAGVYPLSDFPEFVQSGLRIKDEYKSEELFILNFPLKGESLEGCGFLFISDKKSLARVSDLMENAAPFLTEKIASAYLNKLLSSTGKGSGDFSLKLNFLDIIPDISGICDHNKRIIKLNRAGLRFYNLRQDQVAGLDKSKLNLKKGFPSDNAFEEVYKSLKPERGEYYIETENIWIELSAYPVFDKARRLNYVIENIRDISERKLCEAQLLNAKKEAETANKTKSRYLSQMSHEVRTSINSILSFKSLLKEEAGVMLPGYLRNSIPIIEKAAKRIIRTMDLILYLSELQTGSYEPIMARFDLFENVIDHLYITFLHAAKEKGLRMYLTKDSDEYPVYGDQYTINQIFSNLLDNAVKYTRTGKITVELFHRKDKIIVEISDTGVGISGEYLPKLFEEFSTEHHGYTREFEGNGIGLALVKQSCALNKVVIEVKSVKGEGSVFRVKFNSA